MSAKCSNKDSLWRKIWQHARPYLLAVLPVIDVPSRCAVRKQAVNLVRCDPWPGLAATGEDAAQLAILRLRSLQRDTRRAVRSGQSEAAIMLARGPIETLIPAFHSPDPRHP